MAKEKVISKRFSFEGWHVKEWAIHNAKTIKEMAKWAISAGTSWVLLNNPAYASIATLAGKLVLDSIEYWFKERTA